MVTAECDMCSDMTDMVRKIKTQGAFALTRWEKLNENYCACSYYSFICFTEIFN